MKHVMLVVMANNAGDKGKPFLDWTVNAAPDHMVKILFDFPIINYVRAIICYSGPSEASYFKTHKPDAFKEKDEGRLSRALFLYREEDKTLPFESDSFAGRIWQSVMSEQPDRPLSLSASPNYLHLDKLKHPSHLVGSEFGHPKPPSSGHGFFTYTDIPSDRLKTITLTTEDGPKAKHLQKRGKLKA